MCLWGTFVDEDSSSAQGSCREAAKPGGHVSAGARVRPDLVYQPLGLISHPEMSATIYIFGFTLSFFSPKKHTELKNHRILEVNQPLRNLEHLPYSTREQTIQLVQGHTQLTAELGIVLRSLKSSPGLFLLFLLTLKKY